MQTSRPKYYLKFLFNWLQSVTSYKKLYAVLCFFKSASFSFISSWLKRVLAVSSAKRSSSCLTNVYITPFFCIYNQHSNHLRVKTIREGKKWVRVKKQSVND
jgi:hypothetical protein